MLGFFPEKHPACQDLIFQTSHFHRKQPVTFNLCHYSLETWDTSGPKLENPWLWKWNMDT